MKPTVDIVRKLEILKNSLKSNDREQILFPLFFDRIIRLEVLEDTNEVEKRARIIIAPKFNHEIQIEIIVTGVDYYSVNEEVVNGDNIDFGGRLDILSAIDRNVIYVSEYGADIFNFTAKGVFINEAKYIDSL